MFRTQKLGFLKYAKDLHYFEICVSNARAGQLGHSCSFMFPRTCVMLDESLERLEICKGFLKYAKDLQYCEICVSNARAGQLGHSCRFKFPRTSVMLDESLERLEIFYSI